MSSPSAYYVQVQENQRREEARRQAAVQRAVGLMETLAQLREQAMELSSSGEADEAVEVPFLAKISTAESRAAVEAWILDAQQAANALRAGIARAAAHRADRKLLASLRRNVGGKALSVADVVANLAPPTTASAQSEPAGTALDWRLQAAEEAARLSARLGRDVFEDDRDVVTNLVSEVAASEAATQARIRLDQLRLTVQDALARGWERSVHTSEALDLLAELRGLDHPERDPVAAALQRVADGRRPMTDDLRHQSRRIVASASAAADDQYALDVLAEAFADLQYDVHPGFTTELAENGMSEFRSGRWKAYGVRVHFDPDHGLRTHLVRYEAGEGRDSERRDRSVAEAFCEDLDRIAEEAAERGVVLGVNEQHPPGSEPVMVVPHVQERSGGRRQVAKPKLREHKR